MPDIVVTVEKTKSGNFGSDGNSANSKKYCLSNEKPVRSGLKIFVNKNFF